MAGDWTDRIVGARMAADREFEDRVEASQFSRQEWGLIMTATEFEIEHPGDPDRARLVGNTEKLPSVAPELERIAEEGPRGAPGGGQGGSDGGSSGGGVLGSIKDALGVGGGGSSFDDSKMAAAESLVAEYTDRLQQHLEDNGRWDEVREAAQHGERDE